MWWYKCTLQNMIGSIRTQVDVYIAVYKSHIHMNISSKLIFVRFQCCVNNKFNTTDIGLTSIFFGLTSIFHSCPYRIPIIKARV